MCRIIKAVLNNENIMVTLHGSIVSNSRVMISSRKDKIETFLKKENNPLVFKIIILQKKKY